MEKRRCPFAAPQSLCVARGHPLLASPQNLCAWSHAQRRVRMCTFALVRQLNCVPRGVAVTRIRCLEVVRDVRDPQ